MPKQPKPAYIQKFRSEWENDPLLKDWILRVPGNEAEARCKFCGCVLKARYNALTDHKNTKKHTRAAEPFAIQRGATSQITLPFKPVPPRRNETSVAEAGMALFVTCHCALRSIDHLTKLNKCVFQSANGSKDIQLGRTKCTAIIKNIFSPHFISELRADIGDSPYGILIDESTDIGVTKQLGLCIIYISKTAGRDVSTFLDLYQLEKADAASIVDGVKAVLGKFGLDLQKMRGIGTDNASVMTGINTGVYQRLKAEIPHLVLIRCVCHLIQLAVSAAVKGLPRQLEFLIAETYAWFARSADRQALYSALYKAMNDGSDPLKILQQADTRWLSICPAVKRVLTQWIELRLHFQVSSRNDRSYKADVLFGMYSDVQNELFLIFLEPILEECNKTNKLFQTSENDPVKLLESLTLLIEGLAGRVVDEECGEDLLKIKLQDHLKPNPDLGLKFESKMKTLQSASPPHFTDTAEEALRKRCIDFIVALVTELQRRLPDNVHILKSISLLCPEKCLRRVKPSIVALAELMHQSPNVIARIELQWSKLQFVDWTNTKKTVPFWMEVLSYKDASGENPFQDLADLALMCIVLPWSNGEIERVFSMMNVVKTSLRNKLNDDTLVAILVIRAGLRRLKKCCDSYEFPRSVFEQIGTNAVYQKPNFNAGNNQEGEQEGDTDDDLAGIEDFILGLNVIDV